VDPFWQILNMICDLIPDSVEVSSIFLGPGFFRTCLNISAFEVQGRSWICLIHREDMKRAKVGRGRGKSWQVVSDFSLLESSFCSPKQ